MLVLITATPISLKFILIAFGVELMNYLIYFGSYIILYYDKKKKGVTCIVIFVWIIHI